MGDPGIFIEGPTNNYSGVFMIETGTSDGEEYWTAKSFVIITDNTKPAIKWAASELKARGKNVYVVDLSDSPAPDSLKNVSDLPLGVNRAIIGITKSEPAPLIPLLKEKGINKIWFHWNTETEKAVDACQELSLEYMTGRCPMLYLGKGFSIHGVHRAIAKAMGKY